MILHNSRYNNHENISIAVTKDKIRVLSSKTIITHASISYPRFLSTFQFFFCLSSEKKRKEKRLTN